nr:hyp [Cotesia vestalis bracovirus]
MFEHRDTPKQAMSHLTEISFITMVVKTDFVLQQFEKSVQLLVLFYNFSKSSYPTSWGCIREEFFGENLKNNSQCYLILCAPYEEVMSNICSSTQKSMFEEASEKPKINHCRPRNFHCTGNADCCSGVCRPISITIREDDALLNLILTTNEYIKCVILLP